MKISHCKICHNEFQPKSSHLKFGWGVFCSKKCKDIGQITSKKFSCFMCNKKISKTPSQVGHSKSGKFFCSKSCQTKWRNTQYIGSKHLGFKDGRNSYQSILKREKITQICSYCGEKDIRVLATHHVDENHKNNDVKNLVWLCHNCHLLVHYDKVEKQKFLIKNTEQCK